MANTLAWFCVLVIAAQGNFSGAAPVRCPTDIVYVVDQSTSVTISAFRDQLIPFLINMTDTLDVGQKGDHVSLVRFSSPSATNVTFHFDYSFDKTNITETMLGLQFAGGTTWTKKALELVRTSVFTMEHGARRLQYGNSSDAGTVAPVLLIITDGFATDGDPSSAAAELRLDGVDVFAVGVGPQVTDKYLLRIAGDKDHIASVSSYQDLNQKLIQDVLKTTKCSTKK